jgi:hypothetical protein
MLHTCPPESEKPTLEFDVVPKQVRLSQLCNKPVDVDTGFVREQAIHVRVKIEMHVGGCENQRQAAAVT